ncbi:hypothetical protein IK110_00090 [Candidatus Saccharibacteria bacterium]|nr:hypothetical protein [Candidatus Saccharibacteria bacterium]
MSKFVILPTNRPLGAPRHTVKSSVDSQVIIGGKADKEWMARIKYHAPPDIL